MSQYFVSFTRARSDGSVRFKNEIITGVHPIEWERSWNEHQSSCAAITLLSWVKLTDDDYAELKSSARISGVCRK